MAVDLILHNAKIYTVDLEMPWVEALAITSRRISHIGSEAEISALAGPNTDVVDLENRLVLPGLCDAHIHLYDWSLARKEVPVAHCHSKEEMLKSIADWSSRHGRTKWLSGRGWNERNWENPSLPTRQEIDQVTYRTQPAIFWRNDMHAAVANSAALEQAEIDSSTKDPEGGVIGRDNNGQPNGMLWELAINLVSQFKPDPLPEELNAALADANRALNRLGITAIHDQRMKDQHEGPLALTAYQRLSRNRRLTLRINCNVAAHNIPQLKALGLRSGFGNDYVRLGHVKFFADGSMGSQTAWMLRPYAFSHSDDPEYVGIALTPPEQLADEMQRAIEAGFPISVHAIGDHANRVVLDILEEIILSHKQLAAPHRVEHVQIIDPADSPRLATHNITASVQPIHILDDMDVADALFGPAAGRVYSFGDLAANKTRMALGSDAPVADPNPFLGFHAALYRQKPERMGEEAWFGEQRLSLVDVIRGYTLAAAEAAGWQQDIGSLRPGKLADIIVLDRDLFSLAEQKSGGNDIAETRVVMTIFDGQIVFDNR